MAGARQRILLAEPAGATSLGAALSVHRDVSKLDSAAVDAAAADPEQLARALPPEPGHDVLIVRIAPQDTSSATEVDWAASVHAPLLRCFTLVRGLVPRLVGGGHGGAVAVVLPSSGLISDARRAGESVLGRSLLGLFEGLRAELLPTDVRVSVVLSDEGETEAELVRRIEATLARMPLYALPGSVTRADIESAVGPWLDELARTPADLALPPAGPMGEVYRRELGDAPAASVPVSAHDAVRDADGWRSAAVAGKTAIVTGGASGIGLGITEALLERGLNVVIADVRDDHLDAAGCRLERFGERVVPMRLDVTDPQAWRDGADVIWERFGGIDLLVLNAGIGVLGTILASNPADWHWVMGVNLAGVTKGIEALLPLLRAGRSGGHIVATSSAGGLMVAHDGGIYSAAKFGVVALMECLRDELSGELIGVTTLCPAGVNTNIHDHETMRPAAFSESGVRGSADELAEQQARAREMLSHGADPRAVGDMVVAAIDRNAPIVFTDGGIAPIIRLRGQALSAAARA
jgi:NAD(P)-dependent dehydrogenase (short-subunit alcohol dehydrogenase family)